MRQLSRRAAIQVAAAGGGMVGLRLAAGYAPRGRPAVDHRPAADSQ